MTLLILSLSIFLLSNHAWAADGDPCTSSYGTVSAAQADTDAELCGSPAANTTTTTTAVTNCAAGAISSATITLTSSANFDTSGGSASLCNASGVCNNFTYTSIAANVMSGVANDANGGLSTCTGNYASGSRVYAMTTATNLARRLRILMTALQSAQKFIGEVNTSCAGRTGQGQACWNTTSKLLSIGDGAALNVLAVGDSSGNATGVVCTACITLTTEVTGVLPLANGGTNAALVAVNGGILYSTAAAGAISAAGTSGQALISGGAGAPTWFAPTAASVLYAGASGILAQDNTNFTWVAASNVLATGATAGLTLPGAGGHSIKLSNAAGADTKTGILIDRTYPDVGDAAKLVFGTGSGDVATRIAQLRVLLSAAGEGALAVDLETGAADAAEVARFTGTGRLGINTTTPNTLLEVVSTSAGATTSPVTFTNSSTAASTGVQIRLAPTTSPTTIFSSISATNDGANNTFLRFFTTRAAAVTEKMQITDIGVLLVGTTVTTGTAAGDINMANNTVLRAVNNAGTGTVMMASTNTSDQLLLCSTNCNDIRWGKALVTLGGVTTVTLGTTGGAGPAAAAQNAWMRVVDSTGAAFFVPAWK